MIGFWKRDSCLAHFITTLKYFLTAFFIPLTYEESSLEDSGSVMTWDRNLVHHYGNSFVDKRWVIKEVNMNLYFSWGGKGKGGKRTKWVETKERRGGESSAILNNLVPRGLAKKSWHLGFLKTPAFFFWVILLSYLNSLNSEKKCRMPTEGPATRTKLEDSTAEAEGTPGIQWQIRICQRHQNSHIGSIAWTKEQL